MNLKIKNKGFSLVEILIAMIFLSLLTLGVLWMNTSSNRSSMDAYYEFMAIQLALEPIEIFRAFGYDWLSNYGQAHTLPDYPLNEWTDVKCPTPLESTNRVSHPVEATMFQRKITLSHVTGSPKAFHIKVSVAPRNESRARRWLLRREITMEGLVFEKPR